MTVSEPSAPLSAHPESGQGSFPAFGEAPSRPPGRAGAHLLLWLGLLVIAVATAWLLSHGFSVYRFSVVGTVLSVLYGLVFAGFGLLSRRGGPIPLAAVLWLLATIAFVVAPATVTKPMTTLAFVLFNAAYLVVRRTSAIGCLFLIITAVLEFIWPMVFGAIDPGRLHLGFIASFTASEFVFMAGATALMAPATLLAGLVTRNAARRPPALAPWAGRPGYPAQMAYPGQPGDPAQPAYPAQPTYAAQAPYAGQPGYPPAPAHPGYAPAPYGYAPFVPRTNTLAIVALVLGLVGVSLGGVICGHIALSQIRRTGEGGRGMAIAGLVLGYIWIAVSVVLIVAAFSATSRFGTY